MRESDDRLRLQSPVLRGSSEPKRIVLQLDVVKTNNHMRFIRTFKLNTLSIIVAAKGSRADEAA
jgi:hypothetical protein